MRTGLGRRPTPPEPENPIWKAWRMQDLTEKAKTYRSRLETLRRQMRAQRPVDRNLAERERELLRQIETLESGMKS